MKLKPVSDVPKNRAVKVKRALTGEDTNLFQKQRGVWRNFARQIFHFADLKREYIILRRKTTILQEKETM